MAVCFFLVSFLFYVAPSPSLGVLAILVFFFGSQNPNRERERERVCGSWVSKEEERRRNGESTLWLRQVVVRRFVRHARRAPRRPIILSTADDVDVGDGRSRKSPAPNRLSDGLFGPSRFPQFFFCCVSRLGTSRTGERKSRSLPSFLLPGFAEFSSLR